MARIPKTAAHIKVEIAKLHGQLRQLEDREAERLGRLAIKAGLHEMKGSDSAILKSFQDLVRQFQTNSAVNPPRDKTEAGNG